MSPERTFQTAWISSKLARTATVPKMAPLAPTDGMPTSEKLPPRTFLNSIKSESVVCGRQEARDAAHPKIPAAKYVTKNPPDPISRSIWKLLEFETLRVDGPAPVQTKRVGPAC